MKIILYILSLNINEGAKKVKIPSIAFKKNKKLEYANVYFFILYILETNFHEEIIKIIKKNLGLEKIGNIYLNLENFYIQKNILKKNRDLIKKVDNFINIYYIMKFLEPSKDRKFYEIFENTNLLYVAIQNSIKYSYDMKNLFYKITNEKDSVFFLSKYFTYFVELNKEINNYYKDLFNEDNYYKFISKQNCYNIGKEINRYTDNVSRKKTNLLVIKEVDEDNFSN